MGSLEGVTLAYGKLAYGVNTSVFLGGDEEASRRRGWKGSTVQATKVLSALPDWLEFCPWAICLLGHCPASYHSVSSMKAEVLSFLFMLYLGSSTLYSIYFKESRLLLRGRIIVILNKCIQENS